MVLYRDFSSTKHLALPAVPSSMDCTNTFHSFPRLPTELRSQIWAIAYTCPRIVSIKAQNPDYEIQSSSGATRKAKARWLSSTPTPSIMHACKESRILGPYAKSFLNRSLIEVEHESQSRVSRCIWINWDIDMVSVDAIDGVAMDYADQLDWLTRTPSVVNIQRLRLSVAGYDVWDFVTYLGRKLKPFKSLRELRVMIPFGKVNLYVGVTLQTSLEVPWSGTCDPNNVYFVDRRTGLFLNKGDARLVEHWGFCNGGLLTDDEKQDLDPYAVCYYDSWITQAYNVLYHQVTY